MSELAESILDKISQYNIFNYLLPGAVFAAALPGVGDIDVLGESLVVNLVVMYFAGMVLSRIGSLVVEPALKSVKFVVYSKYSDFVAAEAKDQKITTLSQENNAFRTMAAVFLVLLLAKIYASVVSSHPEWRSYFDWGWLVVMMLLFAFAYRKQSAYIAKRVAERIKQ